MQRVSDHIMPQEHQKPYQSTDHWKLRSESSDHWKLRLPLLLIHQYNQLRQHKNEDETIKNNDKQLWVLNKLSLARNYYF